MDDKVTDTSRAKAAVLVALAVVFEPVVRLMLRSGITWKEFSELSKAKFVEVAGAEFGIRGRPTNASRVTRTASARGRLTVVEAARVRRRATRPHMPRVPREKHRPLPRRRRETGPSAAASRTGP